MKQQLKNVLVRFTAMTVLACATGTALPLLTFGAEPGKLEKTLEEIERNAYRDAIVTHGAAGAPIGHFLLIRKENNACAIRFTEYHRDPTSQAPSVFTSGGVSVYAEYDWYFQGDGSGDFSKQNVKVGHAKLANKPLVGIGRMAFQTGTTLVRCGPFKLWWQGQRAVSFFPGTHPHDEGIELAPTKWRDVAEIDIRDPQIKWYRYDENREITYIPVDELW